MAGLAVLFAFFVVIIAAVVSHDLPQEQALAVRGLAFLFFMTVSAALLLRRLFMKSQDKLVPGGPDVPTAVGVQDDINPHLAEGDPGSGSDGGA